MGMGRFAYGIRNSLITVVITVSLVSAVAWSAPGDPIPGVVPGPVTKPAMPPVIKTESQSSNSTGNPLPTIAVTNPDGDINNLSGDGELSFEDQQAALNSLREFYRDRFGPQIILNKQDEKNLEDALSKYSDEERKSLRENLNKFAPDDYKRFVRELAGYCGG